MSLKQAREQNLPVGSNPIKEKTLKLAELMYIPNFTATDGWPFIVVPRVYRFVNTVVNLVTIPLYLGPKRVA